MKILMVCLGNICRSPMAEGIFKDKIKQLKLNWKVDSAGTSSWHQGDKPDKRAIAEMKRKGIDISSQRSRPFLPSDFSEFQKIFVMDENNKRDLLEYAQTDRQAKKIELLLTYAGHDMLSVPDPYYGTEKDFEATYTLLNDACDKVIDRLIKENA
ncbi:MAG: low molecular weight phosphotyrosine protein phosphatase [Bacteroidetes bacterium]|nr:low molecular weight phosphotyrosine protein phosphatase [Bacteroidota bacterium]